MTEEEAKVKWCPFVRVQDEREGYAAINRHPHAPKADQMCIASACMAWRWDGHNIHRGPVVERFRAVPGSAKPAGDDWGYEAADPNSAARGGDWVRFESVSAIRNGFCGLAGAPQ